MKYKKKSKSVKKEDTIYAVYLIYSKDLDLYKIGVSNNVYKRKRQLQTGSAYYLTTISYYLTERPFKLEKALHNHYNAYKKDSEKRELEGEWFALPYEIVEKFKDTCKKIEKTIDYLIQAGNPFV